MVKYKPSSITAKKGLNFIRSVVEENGSLFHKVEQESDLGIDAVIEFIRGEQPLHRMVAVQIKSGRSFFNSAAAECKIPVEDHREYWLNYRLPVLGFVYVPNIERAYWVNIKRYLEQNKEAALIKFAVNKANQLDHDRFNTVFVPTILGEAPQLSLEEPLSLLQSEEDEERSLGLRVAFRRHVNRRETWDAMVALFLSRNRSDLPPILVYYFAHIPWHGDIAFFGEPLREDTRQYARTLFDRFGKMECVKLLEFIDAENMISRGSLGQSVEAVIASMKNGVALCGEIAAEESMDFFVRECAALVFAVHRGQAALPVLEQLKAQGSTYSQQIITIIKEVGGIYPYQ